MRAGVLGRALVLCLGLMGFGGTIVPAPAEGVGQHGDEVPSCIPRALCCKMCDDGKACGNSCISRSRSCQKRPGCACDANDICE